MASGVDECLCDVVNIPIERSSRTRVLLAFSR